MTCPSGEKRDIFASCHEGRSALDCRAEHLSARYGASHITIRSLSVLGLAEGSCGDMGLGYEKRLQAFTQRRKIGSEGRIRTCDQVINSHLRYRCATSEHGRFLHWWRVRVTIPRHADYDSAALPTELTRQVENAVQNIIAGPAGQAKKCKWPQILILRSVRLFFWGGG